MSENVVQFAKPEPERYIWRCDCGCLTQYVHADAGIECANCGVFANGGPDNWREPLPELPAKPKTIEADDVKIRDFGDRDIALRRAIKRIDLPNVRALVVINEDGSMNGWGDGFETKPQQRWLSRRMTAAKKMLVGANG